MPNMNDQLNEVDGNLKDVYDGIKLIQVLLKPVRTIETRSGRSRSQTGNGRNQANEIKSFRGKWLQLMRQFFRLQFDQSIYDKLAKDVIESLVASKKYRIKKDLYKQAMSTLVTPIIALIMDDTREPSKNLKEEQESRMRFLTMLLQHNMLIYEEEIDVCNSVTQTKFNVLTEESKLILDLLFDALLRVSKDMAANDLDIQESVYHIINSTYIVQVIQQHIEELRSQLQLVGSQNFVPYPPVQIQKEEISTVFNNYEELVKQCLDLIDVFNPMVIFRGKLVRLLVTFRILIPFVKRCYKS